MLGGSCFISAKLDEGGQIAHVSDIHRLAFGDRSGGLSPRAEALAAAMAGVKFEAVARDEILLVVWEKWVFLAALAGITCLTRAAVGDIVAAGGAAGGDGARVGGGWPTSSPAPEAQKCSPAQPTQPAGTDAPPLDFDLLLYYYRTVAQ